MPRMVHPLARVFLAASAAGAVMIGAVLVDASHSEATPARPPPVIGPADEPTRLTHPVQAAPSPSATTPAAENATTSVTDEQILTLLEAHPELRASIEELMNDPDPSVRKESAALVLELAAARAEISR